LGKQETPGHWQGEEGEFAGLKQELLRM